MTPQRHQIHADIVQNVMILDSYGVIFQDLKSWASVKRACQFDSGPGHQLFKYHTLSSKNLDKGQCLEKRHLEPIGATSDTTMTPENHSQLEKSSTFKTTTLNTTEAQGGIYGKPASIAFRL